MEIKLIYFHGCPNFEHAKAALLAAGVAFDVVIQDDLSNEHPYKQYSSPTILQGEEIILGNKIDQNSSACSIEKIDADVIKRKLSATTTSTKPNKSIFAAFGSIGSALTVGLCPVCIPAIGAFLSSIGLGFLVQETILKPVLLVFIAIALFGFLWSFLKEHKNIYPLLIGIVMAVSLYSGRYIYFNFTLNLILMYGGVVGIIMVSIWNWKLRKTASSCGITLPAASADRNLNE